jgi:hypothetical protein
MFLASFSNLLVLKPQKMITETDTYTGENKPAFLLNVLNAVEAIRQEGDDKKIKLTPLAVQLKPREFNHQITIEVLSENEQELIVKFRASNGKILRLFGWQLIAGSNVTTLQQLERLPEGNYVLEIYAVEGELLFSGELSK